MNGMDLRRAIEAEDFEGIEYTVKTVRGRSFDLPELEVYVTRAPNLATFEALSTFVLNWFNEHKNELEVRPRKDYYTVRGIRFPWPRDDSRREKITEVAIILSGFAL